MKFILPLILIAASSLGAAAQKSTDAINQQIRSLRQEKAIGLSFDGSSSKVMARSPSFSDAEAKAAGIQAMNFGMAFFFSGQQLSASPETINFTFWVLSKKPRFAPVGKWEVPLATILDLGEYRYAAKPGENMEYLNFKIARQDLERIAASTSPVKFRLASYSFTFTPEQMDLLRAYLAIATVK